MGTVEPCEEIKRLFGADFRRVALNYSAPRIKDGMFENGFGIGFKKAEPHDYFDVVYSPINDADIGLLDKMRLPDAGNPAFYAGVGDRAKELYDNTDYAIAADFGVPGFYETSQKLCGYENLACYLMLEKEFIAALYDRLLELQKTFFRRYIDEVKNYAQVICYADDLGMQDRPQVSPELYRELIKPYHKKIFEFIHSRTDAKIMLHSCGAVSPLLDDLIDAGVDIINPVQTRCAGMEPESLKSRFGSKIIFWGGVDEQQLLPAGTPEQVARNTEYLKRVLGSGGGYVFSPSHNLQSDTPPENIIAMYGINTVI
jgi:uroporphyrinogen decarboxylase